MLGTSQHTVALGLQDANGVWKHHAAGLFETAMRSHLHICGCCCRSRSWDLRGWRLGGHLNRSTLMNYKVIMSYYWCLQIMWHSDCALVDATGTLYLRCNRSDSLAIPELRTEQCPQRPKQG